MPIPRSGMPKMVPPSLDSASGRKGTAGEGTHPRRAPLGVVHEGQSVPGVEALRAGEAVAPDQRENHGRGRARRGVNDEWWRREFTCSETCLQKPGFILDPQYSTKTGGGPIDYHTFDFRQSSGSEVPATQRGFPSRTHARAADREAWTTSEMVAAAAEPEKAAAAPAGGKVRGLAPNRSRLRATGRANVEPPTPEFRNRCWRQNQDRLTREGRSAPRPLALAPTR